MERIGVRELRQNASKYLKRVAAGESILVTDRGRVVAVLNPPKRDQALYDELVATGELVPGDGGELPEPLPAAPTPNVSDRLLRRREQERF
ncbi:type II toxin-antitoxin system Phd/YefM family antitoxin [Saccharopolyspora phatthalungensis]|uniref:Antitoxin n=1 Tax=Saccharopolyspora phatthalungensis TaxID=664693 RepID=A0A840Q762_9PSEU|nr:type II toxin-antitoxin system prevent-host-death family antitoxin [Saccharopolyspora phatthalungensis]MBB5155551.1 prevent-host-death family protein [Saccharopolyspora phatthalungensis]